MKYDAIILGGGLSGLVTGIALCRAGHSTAIISSGQSALHFNSGSYGLLGHVDGKEVSDPSAAIASLEAPHPYARIGAANLAALEDPAPDAALCRELDDVWRSLPCDRFAYNR